MGRQFALVASPKDVQALLKYLRERGPIQGCVRGTGIAATNNPSVQWIAPWVMPKAAYNGQWNGIKGTVNGNGECQVEYNHDQ